MIERLKSFVLILLIMSSLVQSYMLAYSKPILDQLNEMQYIETQLLGEQREIQQMIFPQRIFLHSSSGHHTILYPETHFYDLIYNKVKEKTFGGFREMTRSMSGWDKLRHVQDGVEIIFKNGVPIAMLTQFLQIEDADVFYSADFIDRIWLTKLEQSEEIFAFFFSESTLNVYEATRTNVTARDLEQFIGFGAQMPAYTLIDNDIYVPEQPLSVIRYRLSYYAYRLEQLQNSLFIDPSISQTILDRDGTEIITDGKRGIIVDRDQEWMSYSDFVPASEIGNDVQENLTAAVQFINRHGGWNGRYLVTHVPSSRNQQFIFNQYYQSFPIVPAKEHQYGYMKIVLQKGVVSNYERSLINLNFDSAVKNLDKLPGGEELIEKVRTFARLNPVTSIIPAYYPVVTDRYIDLIPWWAAELADGTLQLLP